MQITHEEARQLIRSKVDDRLNTITEDSLNMHLKACRDCQRYLESLREVENTLRKTMRRQWNLHPLPLSSAAVYAKVKVNPVENVFVTTRTALIGAVFVMFAFIAWQSMATMTAPTPSGGALPLIPTPSSHTATNTLQSGCKEIQYIVQPGDTLESIAGSFSVSKEAIIAANHLPDETLGITHELIIPFCELTPTSTLLPPTFTITPSLQTISTTPG
jgi:hypothetical protein